MEKIRIEKMRDELSSRRAEVLGEIARMSEEIKLLADAQEDESGGVGNHLADDGSHVMEAERLATMSEDLQDVLAQIDSAMQRIDAGSFGTCQRCGQEINPERLEAFPYVAYCINCQTLIEREHSLRAGI